MVTVKAVFFDGRALVCGILIAFLTTVLVSFCAEVPTLQPSGEPLVDREENASPPTQVEQDPRNPTEQLSMARQETQHWQAVAQETYSMERVAVEDLAGRTASEMKGNQNAETVSSGQHGEKGELGAREGGHEQYHEDGDMSEEGEEVESDRSEWGGSISENDGEESDAEKEEHHHVGPQARIQQIFVGIAYELPVHLRPREGGADPGYLQLVLDEKTFNELMNYNPNTEVTEDDAEKAVDDAEKKPQNNGAFMVCYVKEADELEERFGRAVELGEGVYIPLQRMTDFARHKDFTLGNPGVQDVQLSTEHYNASLSDWDQAYFDRVKELKTKTHLKVGGMWIGPPDYEKIDRLLKQHPDIFEGIYFNWEDGEGSCMNNLGRPPKLNAEGKKTYWADKPDFFFRYYMGGQDGDVCKISDGRSYVRDVPVNIGRDLTLPDGVSPVFPCFAGNEGLCYKAFSRFLEAACDSNLQRYSFAIYDRYSDRMRLMLEEGCKNLGLPVPAMDFVGAV